MSIDATLAKRIEAKRRHAAGTVTRDQRTVKGGVAMTEALRNGT